MRLVFLLVALGIALVFYLSWVPNPDMALVWFVPDWIANWTDARANGDLRTAVPFVFLGLITGVWLFRLRKSSVWWLATLVGLTGIAAIAEAGQIAMPHRHFSWADIGWGGVGSFLGLLVAYGGMQTLKWLKVSL
ncbi:hypothetical protein [Larkinella humicola]|uniref:VanZ like protein n=1 Tax=Larkinella humicola TaxID=2607654 RepID=A0A5N1JIC1_9BACT|nr:hypothetical protein [Larkinella humicola]KAA9356185.1 hypothetical protein F0P93_00055 [Larkinella humicola]